MTFFDEQSPASRARPTSWRTGCGRAGWAVFALTIFLIGRVVLQGYGMGIGVALHADPSLVAADASAVSPGVWLVLGSAATSMALSILGRRWILAVLSAPLLLVALGLTQFHFGPS